MTHLYATYFSWRIITIASLVILLSGAVIVIAIAPSAARIRSKIQNWGPVVQKAIYRAQARRFGRSLLDEVVRESRKHVFRRDSCEKDCPSTTFWRGSR
jgi:hypothetical protein